MPSILPTPQTETPQTETAPPRFALPRRKPKTPRPRPNHCLNCGEAATGNFCVQCGQETKDHTVALRPLLSDLLAEVVSWDSKLLRTVVPLLFHPGFLTNEYNAGRRVPYLSPLKLYLTISVLFFLVLSWKNPLAGNVQVGVPANRAAHDTISFGGRAPDPLPHSEAEYDARQKRLPPAVQDPPLARQFVHHVIRAGQSPKMFLNALLGDIPKMMFFLLPAFAVSLKLLYLRTRRLYVEHLIFLLHIHAFAFLLLTPLLVAHPDWAVLAVCLALYVYVLVAMRVVYKQNWGKTLVKFHLLVIGYVVLLSLCIAGTTLAALWLV